MEYKSTDHYVEVVGELTYVTKCGPTPTKVLFLVIPGNPGCASYYDEFIETLCQTSDNKVPAWAVSHAGHVIVPNENKKNAITPDQNYYDLGGQIRHKIDFVKEHVPPSVKVILIGHSIGCYIILHLMEAIGDRVLKCGLLFLTIEKMALSPKGIIMTPLMKYFRWMAPLFIYPVSWLPQWFHLMILNLYFGNRPIHSGSITGTQKLISSHTIRNITNMANEEFQTVVDADYHLIEQHMDKLWFYYGSCDHWCPVEYYEDMRKKYPAADISLCKYGFEHAFCLESSKEMAKIVWNHFNVNINDLFKK